MHLALLGIAFAAEPPARIAHFVEHDGHCRWEATPIDPAGAPTILADLPAPCVLGATRVMADGTRALVELRAPGPPWNVAALYDVDLTRGAVTVLPPVPIAWPTEGVGFGADGTARVFGIVDGTRSGGTPSHPAFLSVGDRTFANPIAEGDGDAQLAVEYARRPAGWVLVDAAITETGYCGAPGAGALANYGATVGARGREPEWARGTPAEVSALEDAAGAPPGRFNDGAWSVQRSASGALAQWIDDGESESPQPSGFLLVEVGGAWRPLITPAPDGSAFRVLRRGRHALVIADSITVPARVFDLADGHLEWTETSGLRPTWSPR